MSLTSMYSWMMQISIDTFSALKIASYYNTHWPDYRVSLRNGSSI